MSKEDKHTTSNRQENISQFRKTELTPSIVASPSSTTIVYQKQETTCEADTCDKEFTAQQIHCFARLDRSESFSEEKKSACSNGRHTDVESPRGGLDDVGRHNNNRSSISTGSPLSTKKVSNLPRLEEVYTCTNDHKSFDNPDKTRSMPTSAIIPSLHPPQMDSLLESDGSIVNKSSNTGQTDTANASARESDSENQNCQIRTASNESRGISAGIERPQHVEEYEMAVSQRIHDPAKEGINTNESAEKLNNPDKSSLLEPRIEHHLLDHGVSDPRTKREQLGRDQSESTEPTNSHQEEQGNTSLQSQTLSARANEKHKIKDENEKYVVERKKNTLESFSEEKDINNCEQDATTDVKRIEDDCKTTQNLSLENSSRNEVDVTLETDDVTTTSGRSATSGSSSTSVPSRNLSKEIGDGTKAPIQFPLVNAPKEESANTGTMKPSQGTIAVENAPKHLQGDILESVTQGTGVTNGTGNESSPSSKIPSIQDGTNADAPRALQVSFDLHNMGGHTTNYMPMLESKSEEIALGSSQEFFTPPTSERSISGTNKTNQPEKETMNAPKMNDHPAENEILAPVLISPKPKVDTTSVKNSEMLANSMVLEKPRKALPEHAQKSVSSNSHLIMDTRTTDGNAIDRWKIVADKDLSSGHFDGVRELAVPADKIGMQHHIDIDKQGVPAPRRQDSYNKQLFGKPDKHVQQFSQAYTSSPIQHQTILYPSVATVPSAPILMNAGLGKRRILLRLQEDILKSSGQQRDHRRHRSFFSQDDHSPQKGTRGFFFRGRPLKNVVGPDDDVTAIQLSNPDRGTINVSWYEGTSSSELQEHVRNRVIRKIKLNENTELDEMRILDDTVDPPEEICLSPYIPDGSTFLLRYSTKNKVGVSSPEPARFYGPPDSPSAAPSPHPSYKGLDATQLNLLKAQLDALKTPQQSNRTTLKLRPDELLAATSHGLISGGGDGIKSDSVTTFDAKKESDPLGNSETSLHGRGVVRRDSEITLRPEDPIEARLRQITELLLLDREKKVERPPPQLKRQIVFAAANYFVLFISFLAIMAEIQARAPDWLVWLETHLESVRNCAADQETLYQCVSNGDVAGLIASVVLWMTRSAATKRIFLFGFETPKKLWTVVYESLVTSVCWGVSYIFIRRGMNPDTRENFVHKYWKDAVYGSLAGFNAAFMKHVLKNLIPQEALEEVMNERNMKLKILSWIPTFD